MQSSEPNSLSNPNSFANSTPAGTESFYPGRWWHADEDRIVCDLCPRACRLKAGDRGFCFVRENVDGKMALTTYGRSTGFCIDPIEKKPLNHFLPGTPVLSFGTAGCNLGCKFCQNWDISKSREVSRLSAEAGPEQIAELASRYNCASVAFTYNDPVIWAEYAIDAALACHERDIKTVAVTAGYISPGAREEFFQHIDAANVDLKAFTEDFYYKLTSSHLQDVLNTLVYLKHETSVWFEITNLIIPQANDSDDELRRMCDWILEHLGDDVPVHFSAFHPDFRLRDRGATPPETLFRAHELATQTGLKFAYVGNVHDAKRQSTYCPNCGELLIERDWYELGQYQLRGNACSKCEHNIPGVFRDRPGDWGRKRLPVNPAVIQITRPQLTSTAPRLADQQPQATVMKTDTLPELDNAQRQAIIAASAKCVAAAVTGQSVSTTELNLAELAELPTNGMFVTLHRDGRLRGCRGQLGECLPLAATLETAARQTAVSDHRFPPVQPAELGELTLDVTVLGPRSPIPGPASQRAEKIQIGRDGLRIQRGAAAGLLLPKVAEEQGWGAVQFLEGVCRKAGLPNDAWKQDDTLVETFPGLVFGAPFPTDIAAQANAADTHKPLLSVREIEQLLRWTGGNIQALLSGATPSYYAHDIVDTELAGIVVTLVHPSNGQQSHLTQLNPNAKIPMQSTLFSLAQGAAQWLRQAGMQGQFQLGLTFLSDVTPAGSVGRPSVAHFKPARHALLAARGGQWSLLFQPTMTGEQIIRAGTQPDALQHDDTALMTLDCVSSLASLANFHVASAAPSEATRPPAIAGTFYPVADQERNQMVDAFLANMKPLEHELVQLAGTSAKVRCHAIMTPHAGLRYSGQVATNVWGHIEIPPTVLIIGPKHTRDGVPWAVAPHAYWKLSNDCQFEGDLDLARRLASTIDGMQLDAAAHAREHGIEIQLPILHRVAPQTRIAAIAMSGGDWTQISKAASQLADLMRSLEEPPLLVISSDMNHFASDEENRRRDQLALEAFARRDGKRLLEVCRENDISMCGVVPAALVLETMRLLNSDFQVHRIDYATSGDITGDKSRVVGYAAAILA